MTLRKIVGAIRAWIRANITGGPDQSYNSCSVSAKPVSFDEKLRSTMESTEAMPPATFTEEGNLNKHAVEFWTKRIIEGLFDLAGSGLAAALVWFFWHFTGRKRILESDDHHAEAVRTLFPVAVWLVCFVFLFARRQSRGSSSLEVKSFTKDAAPAATEPHD